MWNTSSMARAMAALALVACCASTLTHATDVLPKRKPGQWEITITTDNPKIPQRVELVCLDEATDALLDEFGLGASRKMCDKFEWKHTAGGTVDIDATCKLGPTQMALRGQVVFSGNTAYRETVRTHYDPPLRGKSDAESVTDGKWTGACSSDMKPGDVVIRPSPTMPTGMRINLNEMLKSGDR
jgi:hypothetical protein